MPEPTEIIVNFIINEAQVKGQLQAIRAEIDQTVNAFKGIGTATQMVGSTSTAAFQAINTSANTTTITVQSLNTVINQTTGTTNQLGQATAQASNVFGQFESMLNRVMIRMAAMELVMGTIRLIGSEFKNAWDLATTEAQFKNLAGDTEETKQAFYELEGATKQDAKATAELVAGYRELAADGTRSSQEVIAEVLKLKDAADALGIPFKQLSSEIAQIRETGQITFSELYKLNEQTGGQLRDGVEWWRWYDAIIKQTEEDIRKQDKAENELAKTADARARLEERAADAAQKGADRAADAQEKAANRAADAQEKAVNRAADAQEKAYDREVDAAQKAADRKADIAQKEADKEADAIQSIRDRARSKGQHIPLSGEELQARVLGQREYALAGARGTPAEYQREGERVQRTQREATEASQLAAREEGEEAARAQRQETERVRREQREDQHDAEKEAKDDAREAAKEAKDDAREAAKEAKDDAKEAAREAKENTQKDRRDQLDDLKGRQKDFRAGQTAGVLSPDFLGGMKGQAETTQPWSIVGTQFKEGMDALKKGNAEDGKMIAEKIQDLINIFQGAH